jgi:hypothetical protein
MSKEALKLALELLESAHVATDLVWKRHDAVEAIKEALAQPEQTNTRPYYTIDELNAWADEKEKQAWRNAAIRIGEELSSVGPDGYYEMDAWKWLDWAMEQEPRGKNSLAQPEQDMPKIGCVNHDCAQCKAQPAQKRPPNCGTGYCSCLECLFEQSEQERNT